MENELLIVLDKIKQREPTSSLIGVMHTAMKFKNPTLASRKGALASDRMLLEAAKSYLKARYNETA